MEPTLTRDGVPMVLHRPTTPEGGTESGVIFRPAGEDDPMTTKAPRDGVYTLGKGRYHIQAGDELPKGAVMDEERKRPAAPENKAKPAAPENRSEPEKPAKDEKKADA